jgi:orotate phosphoribosyltransferase
MNEKLAKALFDLQCVQLSPNDPFTYASGLKGPIYCDNRKIISHPQERKIVIEGFLQKIKEFTPEFDQVAALATAGIPHGAWVADNLQKGMIYIRGSAKSHGKKNLIEGEFKAGQKIILIEDLVNQGSSLEKAVLHCREQGLEILAAYSIVDYGTPKSLERLNSLHLGLYSLLSFAELLSYAEEQKHIDHEGRKLLREWRQNPEEWNKRP